MSETMHREVHIRIGLGSCENEVVNVAQFLEFKFVQKVKMQKNRNIPLANGEIMGYDAAMKTIK